MTDPSIPTSPNRGHIRAVIKPGALQSVDTPALGFQLPDYGDDTE